MKIELRKILLLFFLLQNSSTAYTQNNTIDSLQKVLQTQKEDTNRVNTLNRLSRACIQNSHYWDAIHYGGMALSLAQKISYKQGEGSAFERLGGANYRQSNYPEALKNHYSALKIWEDMQDKQQIANSLQSIGAVYLGQGNDSSALVNWLGSLQIRKEIGDKTGIAQSYNSIASIYSKQGKYSEALENHFKAMKIFGEMGDRSPGWGMPMSYQYLGKAYEGQGDAALKMSEKITSRSKYNEALKNYFFSLQGWQTAKRKDAVLELYGQIGNIYIKLNKLPEARNYLEKCLQLARLIGYKEEIKSSSYNLSRLDSLEQNYQQAYSHYKEYILYRDSIVNEENTKKSLQAQMQYDFDKKEAITQAEQEKKDAEQKRIRSKQYFAIGGLGILLLAVLSIAFIQWRNSKYKQKANLLLLQQKEKVESTLSELKSTQSQLIQSEKMASLGELTAGIAHEIQNPLNFVNNFSEVSTELLDEMITELGKNNKEDAISIAGDVKQNLEKILHHGKQADGIVKGMLQHSRSSSVVKEPTDINKLVDEYLRLAYHGLRAKDKDFNATLKTDYDETIGTINIIPQDIGRVILNLITNSFYAVAEKKKQRPEGYEPTISVSTKKTESDVLISVKDNGNGIPQKLVDKIFQPFFTTKPTGQGTGLGLSLGYDIIKAHGGELKVETKEACPDDPVGRGEGAEFIIQLPR